MYYLFINENQIKKYDGEILKRYVGNKLVKVISNPTEKDLREFTYMELVEAVPPEYDAETQYLEKSYYVEDGKIYEKYAVCEMPEEIPTEEMLTEVVGTASVCFIRKWYCKHYCDLDGCPSYIYGELRYELIQYAHSYIGRYCSSCGYKNPISGN